MLCLSALTAAVARQARRGWRGAARRDSFSLVTVEQTGATIRSVQCLRGLAALMVVLHHLQNQTGRLGLGHTDWSALPSGVDIFFVISGFIMWVTTASKPDRTAFSFYRDGITRIAPLYWLITAFLVAVLVVAPGATNTAVLDWPHIFRSLLFIPAEHPVTHAYQPTLIPGWTLNMEMFFYLLFGAAIAAGGADLRLRCRIIVPALLAIVAAGLVVRPEGLLGFYTQDMVGEFAAGILIGVAFAERRLPRSNWFWVPLVAGFVLILAPTPLADLGSRLVRWGFPASLIVFGAVFVPQPGPAALQRLGDWSYALYLSHPITLAASEKAWAKLAGPLPLLLFPLAAVVAAIIAAWLIHRVAELPLTRAARRLVQPRSPPASPLAT
ncbi:MAG TPA: acyltransferase [Allosphingosinicella sp.]